MEEVAPPGNDSIMWGRSIQSFIHPEHQNPSIISGYRQSKEQIFNFHLGLFSSNFHHQGGCGATCK